MAEHMLNPKTGTLRMPGDLYARVAKVAKQEGRTVSGLIRYCLERYLNGLEEENDEAGQPARS